MLSRSEVFKLGNLLVCFSHSLPCVSCYLSPLERVHPSLTLSLFPFQHAEQYELTPFYQQQMMACDHFSLSPSLSLLFICSGSCAHTGVRLLYLTSMCIYSRDLVPVRILNG